MLSNLFSQELSSLSIKTQRNKRDMLRMLQPFVSTNPVEIYVKINIQVELYSNKFNNILLNRI